MEPGKGNIKDRIRSFFAYNKEFMLAKYNYLSPVYKLAFDKCYRPARYEAILSEQPKFEENPKGFDKYLNLKFSAITSEPDKTQLKPELTLLQVFHRLVRLQEVNLLYLVGVVPIPFMLYYFKKISKTPCYIALGFGMAMSTFVAGHDIRVMSKQEKVVKNANNVAVHQYENYDKLKK